MQKFFSFIVLFMACGLLHGQNSLTLSSANATAGGSATLTLTLANPAGATSPAALQWAITYPAADVSSVTAAAGAAATAAGKTVTCAQAPVGYICVLDGMNTNAIGNGVVASLTFNLTATASGFQVMPGAVAGADPSGELVALSATAGSITVGGSGGAGSGSGSGNSPSISAFGCTPSSVTGGSPSLCTINLSSAAPAGGINVAVSSGASSVTVPATVNIPAGASTGSFQATTSAVAAAVAVTLTGTYNGSSQASLTVTPPVVTISSVICAPATVVGGAPSTCTVNLSPSAGAGGASISLASNSPDVTVPATLNIAAGASTGAFQATTSVVKAAVAVTITATNASSDPTASITVMPPGGTISWVSCAPATVVGGASSTCTVNLSASASSGGASIGLASNSASVTVPATLIIPAGASTGSFQATTSAVKSAVAVTLTATYNGSQTASLTVTTPAVTISSVSCAPATVTGGASSTCTVNLSASAGNGGASLSLSSNSAHVTVPATLLIAASKTTGTFAATTTTVATGTSATIVAQLNGGQQSATLTVDPAAVPPGLSGLSCALPLVGAAASMASNSSVTCTVTLATPAPAAEAITLASNASVLTVPASVTVPSGAAKATFVAQSGTLNSNAQAVTITASAGGVQQTYTFLLRVAVSSLVCVPAALNPPASTTTTCTITLTQTPASALGIPLLQSSSPYLTVPSTLTVAAGNSSATFIGTASSAPYTVVKVSTPLGPNVSATVTVGPVPVKSVSCNPPQLTPGQSATCTVTLVGPSPAGGETVTTSSANASLSVPASVTVPAGATSANFTATALKGYAASAVQITASIGGAGASTIVSDARGSGAPAQSSGTPVPIGARPGAADKTAGAIVARPAVVAAAPQLSCTPQDAEPGGTVTCEVQLGTASAGVELSVSSSHPSLHVPADILSRPHQSSVSFQALVDAAAPAQSMTIQVAQGSLIAQSQVSVQSSALPALNAPGAQNTLLGARMGFRVTAASGTGHALAVRADRLPPGAVFDPATGDFEWTASPAQSGRWETVFTTTDELGRSATAKMPIRAGSGSPEIDRVENAASGSTEAVCASGSLATIRGAWLANGSASDFSGAATSLAGTKVLVNGQTTRVVFVSPSEVTFVCPQSEGSAMAVSVETAMAVSAPASAVVAASAPGIFTTDGSGAGQATATIFEGSRLAMPRNYLYPSQPAQAGDNLSILMTGVAADADPGMLAVRIGGVETHATSVRAVAGMVGVVQVEFTIPGAAPVGDAVPISVRHWLPRGGVPESQTATIAVEPSR